MIERGEIQKSNSPWCLAAFIQPKKSGKGVRLLLDARPLNKLLQQDAFTVPKISTLVGDVAAAQPTVFSTLDLKSGFYNLKVDPESRKMLAFDLGCGQGLYEFLVLGQGLNPGVSAMQRVMTSLLDGCESVLGPDGYRRGGVKAYLDDIIIYSRNLEDHNLLVREVLKRLSNAGFQLALNKANLFMKSVEWLGYRLEEGTLRPLQKNVEKIKSLVGPRKPPRTVSDCRRILGVLNYYRQFCPHFSTIAEPITKLTKTANKTDNLIEWGEEQDKAFYALYDRLASEDCFLVLPDYAAAQHDDPDKRRPFVLFTDASDFGASACLFQADEQGRLRLLYCESKTFNGAQTRWTVTDKEWFALTMGVRKFSNIVAGTHLVAFTDHQALVYLLKKQQFDSPKQARWGLELQQHDMELHHIQGKMNQLADISSRNPDAPVMPALVVSKLSSVEVREKQEKKVDDVLGPFDNEAMVHDFLHKTCNRNIQRMQKACPSLMELKKALKKDSEVCPDEYAEHRKELRLGADDVVVHGKAGRAWVVPEASRKKVLRAMHADGGLHSSIRRMRDMASRLWWPGKDDDICEFVRQCPHLTCQLRHKTLREPPRSLWPDVRGDTLAVDLAFLQHPVTLLTHAFFVGIDVATRFPFYCEIERKTPSEVKLALDMEVLPVLGGYPARILSDHGSEFAGTFEALCKSLDIEHAYATESTGEGNSIVERLNKDVKLRILESMRAWPATWRAHKGQVLYSLRTSPHSSLGNRSPAELFMSLAPRFMLPYLQPAVHETLSSTHLQNVKEAKKRQMQAVQTQDDRLLARRLESRLRGHDTHEKLPIGTKVRFHLRKDKTDRRPLLLAGRSCRTPPVRMPSSMSRKGFPDSTPSTTQMSFVQPQVWISAMTP